MNFDVILNLFFLSFFFLFTVTRLKSRLEHTRLVDTIDFSLSNAISQL